MMKIALSQTRFSILAYDGDKLFIEGSGYIVIDLDTLQRDDWPVVVEPELRNEYTIGYVEHIDVSPAGLTVSGLVTGDQWPKIQGVLLQAAKGHRWEADIYPFFSSEPFEKVPAGETLIVNGRSIEGPFALARNAGLRFIEVCPQGSGYWSEVTFEEAD